MKTTPTKSHELPVEEELSVPKTPTPTETKTTKTPNGSTETEIPETETVDEKNDTTLEDDETRDSPDSEEDKNSAVVVIEESNDEAKSSATPTTAPENSKTPEPEKKSDAVFEESKTQDSSDADEDKTTAVSIESKKTDEKEEEESHQQPAAEANSPLLLSSLSELFKQNSAGKWKCPVCFVCSDNARGECEACKNPRPAASNPEAGATNNNEPTAEQQRSPVFSSSGFNTVATTAVGTSISNFWDGNTSTLKTAGRRAASIPQKRKTPTCGGGRRAVAGTIISAAGFSFGSVTRATPPVLSNALLGEASSGDQRGDEEQAKNKRKKEGNAVEEPDAEQVKEENKEEEEEGSVAEEPGDQVTEENEKEEQEEARPSKRRRME